MEILYTVTVYLNQIVPVFQIIFGTFGNIMNIFIFTRRGLYKHPCSTYFLSLSINNIFVLYVVLLTHWLSSGWNIDPSERYDILCRLRTFFAYVSLCLIPWLIILASIDRFLSSSPNVHYRRLSNVLLARKATIITICFIILIHFHVPIWWTVGSVNLVLMCNIFNYKYDIFFSIFYIIFTCLLPPFLMIIFGIKTILNVRIIQRRLIPLNINERNERLRSKDNQMITMLLFQVLITVICTMPTTISTIYSTINENIETSSSSSNGKAIYEFISSISRLLNYLNSVTGFYIYTLTSRTFRMEFKQMIKSWFKMC